MPFPQSVRDEALVAAARHCCVCHRYKGVKVEVHHIVPESQGGPNQIENAITLCFDCHADAGHYNPNHPRGTKFSASELRLHRDSWHFRVRQHRIQSPDGADLFYCRYLVCRSFDAFREITMGELSDAPIDQGFLVTNSLCVTSSAKSLIVIPNAIGTSKFGAMLSRTANPTHALIPRCESSNGRALTSIHISRPPSLPI